MIIMAYAHARFTGNGNLVDYYVRILSSDCYPCAL